MNFKALGIALYLYFIYDVCSDIEDITDLYSATKRYKNK